jgi:hypothetical protein
VSADGRPPVADLLAATDGLRAAGWRVVDIADQPDPDGVTLPVRACWNADDVDAVLIAGIHGREPAGAVAVARYVPQLIELGRTRSLLVMPLLNPWGYLHDVRYGPSGQSVSDSDHLLGRAEAPACPEADAITRFVTTGIRIRPGASVLDLHEDPVYEAPDYRFDEAGSYFYLIGDGAPDHPAAQRVRACLGRAPLPLVREGVTRFGERLVDGAVVDSADGSIDELLARRLGCSPVITVETVVNAPNAPPLPVRVDVHLAVLDAFFGGQVQEPPCAPRS